MTPTQSKILKIVIASAIAILSIIASSLGLTACNMTRTITTTSQAYQRGDTSVMIQTKTTEVYDGSLKYNPINH